MADKKQFPKGKMVPVPSVSIIPERDVDKTPILECSHLGIDFGGLTAVNEFNITVGRTEIAGLIGPNGAGKTTVFNLLTKVYQPTRGTVMIDGRDTAGKSTIQVSHMGVARTFQNIRLFNSLTVEENVKIGLHNQIRYSALTGVLRLPAFWREERKAHQRALELLSIFDMQDMSGYRKLLQTPVLFESYRDMTEAVLHVILTGRLDGSGVQPPAVSAVRRGVDPGLLFWIENVYGMVPEAN